MLNYLNDVKHIEKGVKEVQRRIANSNAFRGISFLLAVAVSAILATGIISTMFMSSPEGNSLARDTPRQAVATENSPLPESYIEEDLPVIDFDAEHDELPRGQIELANPLDDLNPFSSFQKSVIDGLAEIVGGVIALFDDYVAYTPNIAKGDGNITGADGEPINIRVNKFFTVTQTIAWALLPIIIVFTGFSIIAEGGMKAREIVIQTGKKAILFAIALVSMRFFFAVLIDLNNAINSLVLQRLIGGDSNKLSETLLTAMGLSFVDSKLTLDIAENLNQVGIIILWIVIFFTIMTLLFQFIIRFCHILLHIVMFPIVLVIAMLPGGGQFFKTYVEELIRMIFVQPILLIGLAFTIEILRSVDEPVSKIVLGLGSLAFLNLIPSIVNRFSGVLWGIAGGIASGAVTAATLVPANKFKKGVVAGATGEKSGSLTKFAGSAIGGALGGKTAAMAGTSKSMKNAGSANKLASSAKKTDSVNFSSLGMKPLSNKNFDKGEPSSQMFKASANFAPLQDVSLKDSEAITSKYMSANLDEVFGVPHFASQPQVTDVVGSQNMQFSNPQSEQIVRESVTTSQSNVNTRKVFDTGNPEHMSHLNSWYVNNRSNQTNQNPKKLNSFVSNPENRSEVLKTAKQSGYFKSQGITALKVDGGKQNLTKYYKLANAGNSSTKTK